MPIPQTTAPLIWLVAVLGLMIRPAAIALTTRLTPTVPRSGSTTYFRKHRGMRAGFKFRLLEQIGNRLGGFFDVNDLTGAHCVR